MNNNSFYISDNYFSNPKELVVQSYNYIPKDVVKICSTRFSVPTKGTAGSAAYDIRADLSHEVVKIIEPNQTLTIGTGLTLELPKNLMALLLPRSGLATNHGITLSNAVGLIDPDYRGEIKVSIKNTGSEPFLIKDGDRIAQMLIMGFVSPEFVSVKEVLYTTRGDNGFGSTGV